MLLLWMGCAEPSCPLWYTDLDGDGYGVGAGVRSCEALEGRSRWAGDCEDGDATTHPGGQDTPGDGLDQDCSGSDACEYAIPVDTPSSVDCASGEDFVVHADLDHWPGDCVCMVIGDVNLHANEVPEHGPEWVVGDLNIGGHADWGSATLGAWDGHGLDRLREVSGSLRVNLDKDAVLPVQIIKSSLDARSASGAQLHLPFLVELDTLSASHPVAALLTPSLTELRTLTLDDPSGTLQLSHLLEADRVSVQFGALKLPSMRRANEMQIAEQAEVTSSVQEIDALSVSGTLSAPQLHTVDTLVLHSDLVLPALSRLHTLKATAELDAPRLREIVWVELQGGSVTHTLQYVGRASLNDGNPSLTQLRTRGLAVLEVETGVGVLEGPEHLEELTIGGEGLVLLRTQSIDNALADGWVRAPDLLEIETLALTGAGSEFAQLRRVDRLNTQDCAAFPALRSAPQTLVLGCTLDLRGVVSFPESMHLSGPGTALLPDPYPSGLRITANAAGPKINLDVLDGGLWISSRSPGGLTIRDVRGNVHLDLAGDQLGSLYSLRSVDKDLSICAKSLPHSTMEDWLSTLVLGGEVLNRCP